MEGLRDRCRDGLEEDGWVLDIRCGGIDDNQGSWKRSKSAVFVATTFATEALLTARQWDFVQIPFLENCLSTNLPCYLTS